MNRTEEGRLRRGFAAMSPEMRAALSRKGGKAVPVEKRTFRRDRVLASKAGRKGGKAGAMAGRRDDYFGDER
jgi:general stress protein YciG